VSAAPTPEIADDARPESPFSLRQRFQLWAIRWAGVLAVRLVGMTLRYSLSVEGGGPERIYTRPAVFSFWHRCIFPCAFFFRHMQIGVMISRSFDGESIARIIERFGFKPVRGSSSRGAVRGLLGMRRELEQGLAVAFTIDGPRGPRYVAKPGPVLLAKATGAPMIAFYVALENPWILNSWDAFMVPKPFSRALVRMGRVMQVPANADEAQMNELHRDLQAALDQVREFAEANVHRVGSPEFPRFRR